MGNWEITNDSTTNYLRAQDQTAQNPIDFHEDGTVESSTVDTEELNNDLEFVAPNDNFGAKLTDAADNGRTLFVTAGVHNISSTVSYTKDNDVYIYVSDNAVIKNDGFNNTTLHIDTTGEVVLRGPGKFDFNKSSRSEQTPVAGEIEIIDASDFYFGGGLRIRNYTEFGVWVNGVSNILAEGFSATKPKASGGVDGFHVSTDNGRVDKAVVRPGYIHSGDDSVSFVATANNFGTISVEGGILESEVALGVRVSIRSNADASTAIENVSVDTSIVSTGDAGMRVENNRDNALDIHNVDVDGTVRNPGLSGIQVTNAGSGTIEATVEGSDGTENGVVVYDSKGIDVDASVRNFNTGVLLTGPNVSVEGCSVSGTIRNCGNWGIHEQSSTKAPDYNVFDGYAILDCDLGINMNGTNSVNGDGAVRTV